MPSSLRICMIGFSFFLSSLPLMGQDDSSNEEAFFIRQIYDQALTESSAYEWLTHLSEEIGGRLAGSQGSYEAVDYTKKVLEGLDVDRTWKQECIVPRWERIGPERVGIELADGTTMDLACTALGNARGGESRGEVVMFTSVDDVRNLEEGALNGKIAFFNRPMDSKHVRVFRAYGGAVDQRGRGPAEASNKGAVGCIVRSMTTNLDDVPHSGVTIFREGETHIPAMAITTNDAEKLAFALTKGKVVATMENHSRLLDDTLSYNVIGEIKGSENPDEIILVGGHLDSWDLGGGAHDDGAGCVQSLAVIEILKQLDYQPRHTLRCVMFMNEENGLGGGRAYADSSNAKGEYHLAALESDSGGFSPRGFSGDGAPGAFEKKFKTVYDWLPLLEPYGLTLYTGGSGADINPLKSQNGLLLGLRVDSQRYFDFHHTKNDRIQAVNKRELELGAAAMATMVYLIDKNGL